MKRKFKQLMVIKSTNIIKTNRHLSSWTHWTQKKTTTYDVWNPGTG